MPLPQIDALKSVSPLMAERVAIAAAAAAATGPIAAPFRAIAMPAPAHVRAVVEEYAAMRVGATPAGFENDIMAPDNWLTTVEQVMASFTRTFAADEVKCDPIRTVDSGYLPFPSQYRSGTQPMGRYPNTPYRPERAALIAAQLLAWEGVIHDTFSMRGVPFMHIQFPPYLIEYSHLVCGVCEDFAMFCLPVCLPLHP